MAVSSTCALIKKTQDREVRRDMIADAFHMAPDDDDSITIGISLQIKCPQCIYYVTGAWSIIKKYIR